MSRTAEHEPDCGCCPCGVACKDTRHTCGPIDRTEQDAEDDRNRAVRLARSPGGVLVLDTPGEPIPAAALTDEPPVDEDAAAEARAYERGKREGRARAISEAVRYLRSIEHHASALLVWQHEVEQQTTKRVEESTEQGAASS